MHDRVDMRAVARWLAIRIAALPLIFVVVSAASHFMLFGPLGDDPATVIGGQGLTASQREQIRDELNLDDPWIKTYARWLDNAARGDLGRDFYSGDPIGDQLRRKLVPTFQIVVMSFAVAFVIGLVLARGASARGGVGRGATVLSSVLESIPYFAGLVLLIIIPLELWGYSAPQGYVSLFDDPFDNLQLLLPPSVLVAIATAPFVARACLIRPPFGRGPLAYATLAFTALAAWFPIGIGAAILLERIESVRGVGEWFFVVTIQRDLSVVHALLTGVTFVAIALRVFAPPLGDDPRMMTTSTPLTWRDPFLRVGAGLLILMVVAAVIGPTLSPHDPFANDVDSRFEGPSWDHWFGTTQFGKDVLARLLHELRDSLLFSAWVVTIGAVAAAVTAIAVSALAPRYSPACAGFVRRAAAASALWWTLAVMTVLGFRPKELELGLAIAIGVTVSMFPSLTTVVPRSNRWTREAVDRVAKLVASRICYALAAVILLRATVEFLGVVVVDDATLTLGTEIARGLREGTEYPHLIVFPVGVASVLLFALNLIGGTLAREEHQSAFADDASLVTPDSS